MTTSPGKHDDSPADMARQTLIALTDDWGLDADEARRLLGVPPSDGPEAPSPLRAGDGDNMRARTTQVLEIHRALRSLLPHVDEARTWLRGRNLAPEFAGLTPLERMMTSSAEELAAVARYLCRHAHGEW